MSLLTTAMLAQLIQSASNNCEQYTGPGNLSGDKQEVLARRPSWRLFSAKEGFLFCANKTVFFFSINLLFKLNSFPFSRFLWRYISDDIKNGKIGSIHEI